MGYRTEEIEGGIVIIFEEDINPEFAAELKALIKNRKEADRIVVDL